MLQQKVPKYVTHSMWVSAFEQETEMNRNRTVKSLSILWKPLELIAIRIDLLKYV